MNATLNCLFQKMPQAVQSGFDMWLVNGQLHQVRRQKATKVHGHVLLNHDIYFTFVALGLSNRFSNPDLQKLY